MKTEEYWKTGLVDGWVPKYRDWLDLIDFRHAAYKIIDESDLDEEDKKNEKDVLRKSKVKVRYRILSLFLCLKPAICIIIIIVKFENKLLLNKNENITFES